MIQKIYIQNFRSWKKSEISLAAGINVLVGNSGQGKSNIIRALDWVINNRPSGDSFRSNWAKDSDPTIVRIVLDNGGVVERCKSKSDNFYAIECDENREELRAFGTGVPEEVSNMLRIEDINTQFQLDPPFLLGMNSGQVARYLNEIANLGVIDRSFAGVNKLRIAANNDLKYAREDLERIELEIQEFNYLNGAERELERIERIAAIIEEKQIDIEEIEHLVSSIEEKKKQLNGYPKNPKVLIQKANKVIQEVKEMERRVEETNQERYALSLIIGDIETTEKGIKSRTNQISRLNAELKELIPKECPIYNTICPLYESEEMITSRE